MQQSPQQTIPYKSLGISRELSALFEETEIEEYFSIYYYHLSKVEFLSKKVIEYERTPDILEKDLVNIIRKRLKESGIVKNSDVEMSALLEGEYIRTDKETFYFDCCITSTKRAVVKLIQLYAKVVHNKDIRKDFSLDKFAKQLLFHENGDKYSKVFKNDEDFTQEFMFAWKKWLEELKNLRTRFEHQVPKITGRINSKIVWNSTVDISEDPSSKSIQTNLFEKTYVEQLDIYGQGFRKFHDALIKIMEKHYFDTRKKENTG